MSSKVRVFVSSTIRDLANERDAVVRKILDFNFEPVNAEGWFPNGSKSWDRIRQELLSSHLCVLIIGDRYGWVPDEGPGADQGLSVTHMEANQARAANIPILPFLKELDYEADRESEDAKRRDAFRTEVGCWGTGEFLQKFKLASDLSDRIGAALVGVLSESYLNHEVQQRSRHTEAMPDEPGSHIAQVSLEPALVHLVRDGRAVLLAGAGMSLRAGFPSAQALVEVLAANVVRRHDDLSGTAFRASFQDVAENFELAYGRRALVDCILKALSAPQGIMTTRAHRLSVKLFKTILTTNFDGLFESACDEAGIPYTVVTDDVYLPDSPDGTLIIKLDGSTSVPGSLVLTADDAAYSRSARRRLWTSLSRLMKTHSVVVVGHSLRDSNTRELLRSRERRVPGYVVAPDIGSFDELRYHARGLQSVKSDAESFLEKLTDVVGAAV